MQALVANSATIVLGKVIGAYGVKGWVKLVSFTDPPANIARYDPVSLRSTRLAGVQTPGLETKILELKSHGKHYIARLAGCDDRSRAEQLRQMEIVVSSSQLPPLQEGDYYWHQLIGLRVFSEIYCP